MIKNQEVKFLISREKYNEIKNYIDTKEYDSISSFIRRCINQEIRRNPVGPGKPKKNKNE